MSSRDLSATPNFPIVAKLGGRSVVADHLIRRGLIRTGGALRMHIKRGVIPGNIARELMALAEARSVAYTAADFELPAAGARTNRRRQRGARADRPAA